MVGALVVGAVMTMTCGCIQSSFFMRPCARCVTITPVWLKWMNVIGSIKAWLWLGWLASTVKAGWWFTANQITTTPQRLEISVVSDRAPVKTGN